MNHTFEHALAATGPRVTIGGRFVKIAFAADVEITLAQGLPYRPRARFNRPGQDALYLSPDEASARVAIGEYVKPDDPPRVLLTFDVAPCTLYDLRHPEAQPVYERAGKPWQSALARGDVPPSWIASDTLRAAGLVGLIDPSRRRSGLWHITLFVWNAVGAPRVALAEPPKPIVM